MKNKKKYHKNYYLQHKGKFRDYADKWKTNNKEKFIKGLTIGARKRNLAKEAIILPANYYNNKFIEQNGCCAICGRHQSEFKKALSLDHNHITKKLRGLLCVNCNTSLGKLKSDKNLNLIYNLINYLKIYDQN